MTDLLNGDHHFAARLPSEVLAQLVDLGALTAEDDTGTRGVDHDLESRRRTLDIDVRNAAARKLLLEFLLKSEVLCKELGELTFGEPVRVPIFVVSDPKAVWMNFLSHLLLLEL